MFFMSKCYIAVIHPDKTCGGYLPLHSQQPQYIILISTVLIELNMQLGASDDVLFQSKPNKSTNYLCKAKARLNESSCFPLVSKRGSNYYSSSSFTTTLCDVSVHSGAVSSMQQVHYTVVPLYTSFKFY